MLGTTLRKVFLLSLLLVILLSTLANSVDENILEKVDSQILNELKDSESVRIIVKLKDKKLEIEQKSGKSSVTSGKIETTALETRRIGIRKLQDKVISNSDSKDLGVRHRYSTVNGFSASVNQEGLEDLINDPNVERIYYDRVVRVQLNESVPMINGSSFTTLNISNMSINGTGETVCIIDTGIDFDHVSLGGCFGNNSPSSSCKIVGGYDFVNTDDEPDDDHGHGTAMAGIVISNDSNYAGIAQGAKVIAIKSLNSAGTGSMSDVISGIDWCTNNASLFNISVISLSLGDSEENKTACDDGDSLGSVAVNNAKNAGIFVLAASGNNNHSDGISNPACLDNVTSVGAVYDKTESYGDTWDTDSGGPNSCTDPLFIKDNVTCFSNSAPILDLLAPGALINTTAMGGGITTGGGTSQATPHVAGAAVLMIQFKKLENGSVLTPDELESILKATGKNISDPKNNNVTPRINLSGALNYIDDDPRITITSGAQNNTVTSTTETLINISFSEPVINATIIFDSQSYLLNQSNSTRYYHNTTGLSSAEHNYSIIIEDFTGNIVNSGVHIFDVDTQPPGWSNNVTYPDTGSDVISGNYQFNISWADNIDIDSVLIEHNFTGTLTNYTVNQNDSDNYYYEYSGLSGGTYMWRMHANDTAGNLNSTDQFYYTVVDTCSPPNTIDWVINETDEISCVGEDVEINVSIIINGTLSIQNSNFTFWDINISNNGNLTIASSTINFTVFYLYNSSILNISGSTLNNLEDSFMYENSAFYSDNITYNADGSILIREYGNSSTEWSNANGINENSITFTLYEDSTIDLSSVDFNKSCKISDSKFYITASGNSKGVLQDTKICQISLLDGRSVNTTDSELSILSIYTDDEEMFIDDASSNSTNNFEITTTSGKIFNFTNTNISSIDFDSNDDSVNTITNSIFDDLDISGYNSTNTVINVTTTRAQIIQGSTNYINNLTVITWVSFDRNATANFTEASTIGEIYYLGWTDAMEQYVNIYGNLSILNQSLSSIGTNTSVERLFPTEIRLQDNSYFTGTSNINVSRSGEEVFSGASTTGIINLNLSFNSSDYGSSLTIFLNNFSMGTFSMLNNTPIVLSYDNSAPTITVNSPTNNTYIGTSTVNISLTTDDESTCQYRLNGSAYSSVSTVSNTTHLLDGISVEEGSQNMIFNCTNSFELSTISTINFTKDTNVPIIGINTPSNNQVIEALFFDLNYSINDTSLNTAWYQLNNNDTKHFLPSSPPTSEGNETIVVSRSGKNVIKVFANDTGGASSSRQITVFNNVTLDITEWNNAINDSQTNISIITVTNSTGDSQSGNILIEQDVTLEINLSSGTSISIINFSGYNTSWSSNINIYDSNSEYESNINTNLGTDAIDLALIENYTDFHNDTYDYYAKVIFPSNLSAYETIYYCSDAGFDNCVELSSCTSTYTDADTTACYNDTQDNLIVFVPHFSSVFGSNDTVAPTVTILSPDSSLSESTGYQINVTATTNENASCSHMVDGTNVTAFNQTNTQTFIENLDLINNGTYNLTINCTDSNGNEGSNEVLFTVNDTSISTFSVSVSRSSSALVFSFTTNEPANHSLELEGETTVTQTSYTLSHTPSFSSLSSDTSFDYNATACDMVGNCRTISGETSTQEEEEDSSGDDTGGTTGGGGGSGEGGPSTGPKKITNIWTGITIGNKTMFVSSSAIAITQLIFSVINDISNDVTIVVSVESELPEFIPEIEEKVFQYLRISHTGITNNDIDEATIKFKVDNSWISDNNIDAGSIEMYRFNNGWNKVETTNLDIDSSFNYFEAKTPGFSYFVIVGKQIEGGNITVDDDTEGDIDEEQVTGNVVLDNIDSEEEEIIEPEEEIITIVNLIWPMVFLIGLGILVTFLIYQNKYSVATDSELEELRIYIEKCRSEGLENEEIRQTLINVGWRPSLIDLMLHDVHLPHKDMDKIVAYINFAIKKGTSETIIRENLLKVGWQEEVINEAFSFVSKK